MNDNTIHVGDSLEVLKTLPDECVQTCITSPPYFGLRDYGVEGQIGLEETVQEFISKLVDVFDQVRRVLKPDGTLWLNMGDSYNSHAGQNAGKNGYKDGRANRTKRIGASFVPGFKEKDLMGVPWRMAFALHDAGWYLRQDIIEEVELYCPCGCGYVLEERVWRYSQDREIIWKKTNPMPEPVKDRCTKSHEYIFLLSKEPRYLYNQDAIREPLKKKTSSTFGTTRKPLGNDNSGKVKADNYSRSVPERKSKTDKNGNILGANKRSVWPVAGARYKGAHFATFPSSLIEPCVLAGSNVDDVVLDPFNGEGTVGLVALRHGRRYIGIDLNPDYVENSKKRIEKEFPLFNQISIAA